MARTRSFKTLVHRHVKTDKKFAEALLREGLTWGDLRRRASEAGEEEMRPVAHPPEREGAQASAGEGAE